MHVALRVCVPNENTFFGSTGLPPRPVDPPALASPKEITSSPRAPAAGTAPSPRPSGRCAASPRRRGGRNEVETK